MSENRGRNNSFTKKPFNNRSFSKDNFNKNKQGNSFSNNKRSSFSNSKGNSFSNVKRGNYSKDKGNSFSGNKRGNYSNDRGRSNSNSKGNSFSNVKRGNYSKDNGNSFSGNKRSNYSNDKVKSYSNDKGNNFSKNKFNKYSNDKDNSYSKNKFSKYSNDKDNSYSKNKFSKYSNDKENSYSNNKYNKYSNNNENSYSSNKENSYSNKKENSYSKNKFGKTNNNRNFGKNKKFFDKNPSDRNYNNTNSENSNILNDGLLTTVSNPHIKTKTSKQLKGFNKFNLKKEVILSILKLGYKMPTPIQRKVIPELLSGFNVIAKSRTGSGKSASFIIPTVEKLTSHSEIVGARAIVLSPTRELAKQTLEFFYKLTKGMNLKFAIMTGGDKIEGQYEKLATNPDVIIATPGRLVHHLEEGSVSLKKVEILIIDEADKLIEQGFEDQLNQILKVTPPNKQIGLFSATIPERLANFMKIGIKDYKLITLGDENKIPDTLKLHMITCRTEDKNISLVTVLKDTIDLNNESSLVFCPTKYHCEYLHEYLRCYGIRTLMIYGNMDQSLRDENFNNFKNKKVNVLLVTDLAARGLDIPKLENVINYDFPDKAKLFIHRIGRTARAGKFGRVISLVTPSDLAYLMDTKIFIGKKIISNLEEYVKYYNSLEEDEEKKVTDINNKVINNALQDCSFISYGFIPKHKYDAAIASLIEYIHNKIDFEDIEKSIKNATIKKEKFKEKPSVAGIKSAKSFESENKIGISPLFMAKGYDETTAGEENKLADFLKGFKPKRTIFEQINSETNLECQILNNLRKENRKYLYKKDVEKKKDELKVNNNAIYAKGEIKINKDSGENDIESEEEVENDEDIDDEFDDLENNEQDEEDSLKEENNKPTNYIKKEDTNKENSNKNTTTSLLNKKRKRADVLKEIKEKQFIANKPDAKNSAALWGSEGPLTLNELTLNICPDENLNDKKKSQYVWDEKKKRYVTGISDKKGNLIRKNESGVKIKENEKRVSSYKKWLSTSKIRVQRVGEKEDSNLVSSAGVKYKERKHIKNTKNNNKNNNSEVKNFNQLIKERKETSKKKFRFAGQTRNLEEKKIADKLHRNRKSFVMIKKRGGPGGKSSRGGKGGSGGRKQSGGKRR